MTAAHHALPADMPRPGDDEALACLSDLTLPQLRALFSGIERDPENRLLTVPYVRQRHLWIVRAGPPLQHVTMRALARRGLVKITGRPRHETARLTTGGLWYARAALRLFTEAAANAADALSEQSMPIGLLPTPSTARRKP